MVRVSKFWVHYSIFYANIFDVILLVFVFGEGRELMNKNKKKIINKFNHSSFTSKYEVHNHSSRNVNL